MKINIRPEEAKDIKDITKITIEAFKNHPISQHTEQFIINKLRQSNALTISLVAEKDGAVVGHIAFSPLEISDGTKDWYGVGPLSVSPKYQRQGIGTALLNTGIKMLKNFHAKGCMLVGDSNYYKRFGFKNYPQLIHEGIPQEVFFILPFTNDIPTGTVTFHQAFQVKE